MRAAGELNSTLSTLLLLNSFGFFSLSFGILTENLKLLISKPSSVNAEVLVVILMSVNCVTAKLRLRPGDTDQPTWRQQCEEEEALGEDTTICTHHLLDLECCYV